MDNERKIGVLLAGGESRRFGEPKAFVLVDGQPMYQRSLETLKPLVDEIIIISLPSLTSSFKQANSLAVYEDVMKYQGMGPLAGIYSAMTYITAEWYYVLPCDTPLVTPKIFNMLELFKKGQGVVPVINGRLQPLIAIYHRELRTEIAILLNQGKQRMVDLIEANDIVKVNLDQHFPSKTFMNINTKEHLQSIHKNG